MNMIKCYPGGKGKAFNVTYDDGVEQDVRFVALLDRYGLKGTFNLNSQLMQERYQWIHETGMPVRRLSVDAARGLYDGHEIASHSLTHPYLHTLSEEEVMHQLGEDKRRLEEFFGREIVGFALPFSTYTDTIARCAERCDFEYARISEESRSYQPFQSRFYRRAGLFHLDRELESFVEMFLRSQEELALCQIVGHSYDLDTEDMWGRMEQIFQKISSDKDVLPMTTIELVRYLDAMERAQLRPGEIGNPTDTELWFKVGERTLCVHPGEKVRYDGLS